MKFSELPKYTRPSNYRCDVSWSFLEKHLQSWAEYPSPVQLEPDFQRGHVWTPQQQTRYVEHVLRGGRSGRDVYFNCVNWDCGREGEFVCVDGLQRITAVRKFLDDRLPIFGGYYFEDFTDKLNLCDHTFVFHVNNLATRAEVLQWYLEMNSGGTPHTDAEIDRVWRLLLDEKEKATAAPPTLFQEALAKAEDALDKIASGDYPEGKLAREGPRAYVAPRKRSKEAMRREWEKKYGGGKE